MAGKLNLINETKWSTKDLRKFVTAGLKAVTGGWDGTYTVTVKHFQSRNLGTGHYYSQRMMLRIPAATKDAVCSESWLLTMAATMSHEYDHNIGRKHTEMVDGPTTGVSYDRDTEWVKAYVEAGNSISSTIKAKPIVDKQAQRAAHAQKMLEMHEKKLAREQKIVKKWAKKVSYYEKALAERAPDHLEKVAASRVAAAKKREKVSDKVKRLAGEQGVGVRSWHYDSYESWKVSLNAPEGKHWVNGETHCQRCRGWREALKVLETEKLEDCNGGECRGNTEYWD